MRQIQLFKFYFTLFLAICAGSLFAQAPQSFPYQAVARDSNGNLISNQALSVRFSILEGSNSGAVLYQEVHSVNSNTLGLFSVNVGQGLVQNGSFNAIPWSDGQKYLKIELDPAGGANFLHMGTTQLLSVPFALHAGSAGNVHTHNGLKRTVDSIGLGGRLGESADIVLDGNDFALLNTNGTASNQITQSSFTANQPVSPGPLTQTFTANASKRLHSVDIRLTALPGSSVTVSILNSSGVTLVSQVQNFAALFDNWQSFTFSTQPVLEKNKVYTIHVTGAGTSSWYYSLTNPYGSGNANISATTDYAFMVKTLDELPVLHATNQSVGIGTSTPATTLDVNGQIRIQGGSPSLGKVLSSDATGIGTWVNLTPDQVNAWGKSGNAATNPSLHFIGTTDNKDFKIKVNNIQAGNFKTDGNLLLGLQAGNSNTTGLRNIAIGTAALWSNISSSYNVAIGDSALYQSNGGLGNCAMGRNALKSNTTGDYNIAIGSNSLADNQSGNENIALGNQSLFKNASGYNNVGVGSGALYNNTTGYANIILGDNAAFSNTSGDENVAIGANALYQNTDGNKNVAIGRSALYNNSTGQSNVAIGIRALYDNTTVGNLVAVGDSALMNNTTGSRNVALGSKSMFNNSTGTRNTAVGADAMKATVAGGFNTAVGYQAMLANTSYNNTAIGCDALLGNTTGNLLAAIGFDAGATSVSGDQNTFLGAYSDATAINLTNATAIGWASYVNANNKVRIGGASVSTIEGQVAYSFPSDARFKFDIQENIPGLDFITRLKPVTYRFNTKKFDEHVMQLMPDSVRAKRMQGVNYALSEQILHSGFLAQDIEQICKELRYDFDGLHVPDPANKTDNYSVAYSQFIMPLVKGMQEQQQMISDLRAQLKLMEEKLGNLERGNKSTQPNGR